MSKMNKVACIGKECVACGVCSRACPFGAIAIYKGLYAVVDANKCVGCSKCAKECPAGVITITEASNFDAPASVNVPNIDVTPITEVPKI